MSARQRLFIFNFQLSIFNYNNLKGMVVSYV